MAKIQELTEEHLQELWPVIGGAPHLYEYGKEELKKGLITGDWTGSDLLLDYWTLLCLCNKLQELGYTE